jgi:hypothetical protein
MKVIPKLPSVIKEAILQNNLASFASQQLSRGNIYGSKRKTLLHYIAKYQDDVTLADFCINVLKVKPATRTKKGKHSVLHIACIYGRLQLIRALLLLPGVDINISDGQGETPLSLASKHNNLEVVLELIHLNASISTKNKQFWTPLHWASRNGNSVMVTVFLQLGLNPNHLTINEENALHLASESGCLKTVQILSQAVSPLVISLNGTLLHHGKNHSEILEFHLDTPQWKAFPKLQILLEINASVHIILKYCLKEIKGKNWELVAFYDRDDILKIAYFKGIASWDDLKGCCFKKKCEKMMKKLARWQFVKRILFVHMFSMKTESLKNLPLPLIKEICLYI